MTTTPRPAEFLHSAACLAKAIIVSVENFRDIEGMTAHEFRVEAQRNLFLDMADGYLTSGTTTCICPDDEVESFADSCTREA